MSLEVLQNKAQIKSARTELKERGVSCTESALTGLIRRLGVVNSIVLGDYIKSWDVLKTVDFITANTNKTDAIVDIGSYASEIVVALHKLGFTNLTGVDLNPDLKKMPFSESIRYEISNFMHTQLPSSSFKAVTSISVIEHGFDGPALLTETSRLLMPGGYFIASFDYWPEKIDTTGTKFFNMDWRIFSKQDVEDFVLLAKDYGLEPVGDLHFDGSERPIECGGKKYTFGWLVLKKSG